MYAFSLCSVSVPLCLCAACAFVSLCLSPFLIVSFCACAACDDLDTITAQSVGCPSVPPVSLLDCSTSPYLCLPPLRGGSLLTLIGLDFRDRSAVWLAGVLACAPAPWGTAHAPLPVASASVSVSVSNNTSIPRVPLCNVTFYQGWQLPVLLGFDHNAQFNGLNVPQRATTIKPNATYGLIVFAAPMLLSSPAGSQTSTNTQTNTNTQTQSQIYGSGHKRVTVCNPSSFNVSANGQLIEPTNSTLAVLTGRDDFASRSDIVYYEPNSVIDAHCISFGK